MDKLILSSVLAPQNIILLEVITAVAGQVEAQMGQAQVIAVLGDLAVSLAEVDLAVADFPVGLVFNFLVVDSLLTTPPLSNKCPSFSFLALKYFSVCFVGLIIKGTLSTIFSPYFSNPEIFVGLLV